jgi:hypothetical protein
MPVTIRAAAHASRKWRRTDAVVSTEALLERSCPDEHRRCKSIVQSSFQKISLQSPVYSSSNGFVRGAVDAYCRHHHLVIRPEDVWFAILTQLGFFVNAHAEELRSFFLSHADRKELVVSDFGCTRVADFGEMALKMTNLMAENLNDPELLPWIMPAFSTTKETDKVIASVLVMGAMQKYFSYRFNLCCGIPSVTLLGVRADWEDMLQRLEKLPQLGPEPTQFYGLLKPVLTYFVSSFDSPTATSTIDFWKKIAHKSGGSGPRYLSGWITAFCFWDGDGKSLYAPRGDGPSGPVNIDGYNLRNPGCDLHGTVYHRIAVKDIPAGYASVPVTVNDNGHEYDAVMCAGSVGVQATSSGDALDDDCNRSGRGQALDPPTGEPGPDTLQPVSGWWMYEKMKGQDGDSNETGKVKVKKEQYTNLEAENRNEGAEPAPKVDIVERRNEVAAEA